MLRIYKCSVCGNIVVKVKDSGMDMMCCGKPMIELRPGMTDGSAEKHVPIYTKSGKNMVMVRVGEEEHPMTDIHHIEFIVIETTCGFQVKYLCDCCIEGSKYHVEQDSKCYDGCKPEAEFSLVEGERLINIYEYCNLHGLYVCQCCVGCEC